ncbi:helix-turn-helix domain-containing protein [Shigella flexneri]|uniref:helix-turn-helix domain-containing protein n=1 Tax=Shigella flexneri TaxID=623 RepID=UPI000AA0D282|nr:helix-turn-helix domain-containing protein [Shigella flexneri]
MMVVILTPVDGIIRWLPRGFSCSRRKPSLSEDDIKQMKILLADPEMTVGAVAKRFNVSRMTIYRYTTKGNHSEKINDE